MRMRVPGTVGRQEYVVHRGALAQKRGFYEEKFCNIGRISCGESSFLHFTGVYMIAIQLGGAQRSVYFPWFISFIIPTRRSNCTMLILLNS